MPKLDLAELLKLPQLTLELARVDRELARVVSTDNRHLQKPITRLLKSRSKRLRPALLLAVAANQDDKINKTIIRAAAAIELVHLGSLVHDDIIDNAGTRWNLATINSKEGVDFAIIIGDYLFAKGFELAATISPQAARLIAVTIAKLCDGQSLELADKYNINRSTTSYLKSITGKTAELMSAACQLGGLCAGLNGQQVAALASFGREFGIAYQLIDDVCDLLSSPELAGKPVGSDINEGVYTMPVLLGLRARNRAKLKKLISTKTPASNQAVVSILLQDGLIAKTINEVKRHNALAAKQLKAFSNSKVLNALRTFPDNYMSWSLTNNLKSAFGPQISDLLQK